jgi:uncharacterized damage-inducible protein DinB
MNAQELFAHWRDVRQGLYQALDLLTDEQLAFKPREGLWSLHETVCHIAGTEDGWFRIFVTHELAGWEGADYKAADYPEVGALKSLLAEVHARIEVMYAQDGDRKLKQMLALPWGPQVEHEWVVWHVLEHEIHHRGEIYLMLGLMGMEAPDV